jgi:hypothetical protein
MKDEGAWQHPGGLAEWSEWSGKVLWGKGLDVRQGVFDLAEWRSGSSAGGRERWVMESEQA